MSGKSSHEDPAAESIDPNRLLPGEDLGTRDVEDARHWFSVYSELVQAKADLLAAAADRLAQTREEEAKREFISTDLELVAAELRRLQRHLDFWKARRSELERSPGDDGRG